VSFLHPLGLSFAPSRHSSYRIQIPTGFTSRCAYTDTNT
jgi:hypothetical protein